MRCADAAAPAPPAGAFPTIDVVIGREGPPGQPGGSAVHILGTFTVPMSRMGALTRALTRIAAAP
jgi:hypothetical protein